MITIKNLSIAFDDGECPQEVVHDISFAIAPGEILGIVGDSGSGKTITALTVAGLRKPAQKVSSGEIFIGGDDILTLSTKALEKKRGRDIGMVFQEPMTALNPTMKIGKQVAEPLRLHTNLTKHQRYQKVIEALKEVELEHPESLYHKYPYQLSGGMRQRVVIAAALICKPQLLIADEPTTALDVHTQDSILALLTKLNQKHQTAILFISHNLHVVRTLCHRVLIMKDGCFVDEPMGLVAQYERPLQPTDLSAPKVLEVHDVCAYYQEGRLRKQVLDKVSFQMRAGETVGLLGPSGSGKTTLCKCILGLLKDYEGQVVHYTKMPQMVFQDPFSSLNPKKRIGWILAEPLRMQKQRDSIELQEAVKEVLRQVELPESFSERYPHELSGGQRQRISIAYALISGAQFILADEPLSALDVRTQGQIVALLGRLQEQKRLSILLVSHDLELIKQLCQRVLVIEKGRLVEQQIDNIS